MALCYCHVFWIVNTHFSLMTLRLSTTTNLTTRTLDMHLKFWLCYKRWCTPNADIDIFFTLCHSFYYGLKQKQKNTRRITACITVNKQSFRGGWVWGRKQLIHFKTCSRLMPFTSNQRQVINSLVQVDLCCSDLVDNTAVKWTHLQEMG